MPTGALIVVVMNMETVPAKEFCVWIAAGDAWQCANCGNTAKSSKTRRQCFGRLRVTASDKPAKNSAAGPEGRSVKELAGGRWECRHRGEAIVGDDGAAKHVKCGCASSVAVPVWRCTLLGVECAPRVNFPRERMVSCSRCDSYESADGDAAVADGAGTSGGSIK